MNFNWNVRQIVLNTLQTAADSRGADLDAKDAVLEPSILSVQNFHWG